jgi:DHA2 family methylenomycin A resistance protein-like MFS transporter
MNLPLVTVIKQNKNKALLALCLGFFMVIIDVNIVNVALPTMAKNLGGGVSWLQWVVDGYTLTFACLLLSAGNLGDRLGAKTAYLSGLVIFVMTSLACGLANNFFILTLFRLLQGVSAALLVPTSLALINSSYESKTDRARAIGVWAGVGGFAAASGPVVGALFTAWLGWRAVFLINIPIGIIGILLTMKYVRDAISTNHKGSFDFPGQATGIISIASLAFGLIEAGRFGWSSTTVIISLCVFLVFFIMFIIIEHRTQLPMFPLTFFKSPIFSVSTVVGMIINLGVYGILFLLPLYFQQVREYSVLMTGLAIAPLSGLAAICSYFSGRLASVSGPKIIMIIGLTIGAFGFFIMLIAGKHTPYSFLLLPLLLIGVGGSLTMPAATIAVINSVPEGRAGIASGAFNTSRQIGSLIGVAVFGTIINTSSHFIFGMHSALNIAGTLFILGCVMTLIWVEY